MYSDADPTPPPLRNSDIGFASPAPPPSSPPPSISPPGTFQKHYETPPIPAGIESASSNSKDAFGHSDRGNTETMFKTAVEPESGFAFQEDEEVDYGGAKIGTIDVEEFDRQIEASKSPIRKLGKLFARKNSGSNAAKQPNDVARVRSESASSQGSGGSQGSLPQSPSTPPPRARVGSGGSAELHVKPNYAQKNTKPKATSELTFRPPSVPNAMDEDDDEDFVLEIKCLDDGIYTQVESNKGIGLAGITEKEKKRIRGSVVVGEKLLFEKIEQFKKGVQEQKQGFEDRLKEIKLKKEERRSLPGGQKGGLFKGFGSSAADVHGNNNRRASTGVGGGEMGGGEGKGGMGELKEKEKKSEYTFALNSQPYGPD